MKTLEFSYTFRYYMSLHVVEKLHDIAERMAKVALWCVEYRPEFRPVKGLVVKMLEGSAEIPAPTNPFRHMMGEILIAHPVQESHTYTTTALFGSIMVTDSNMVRSTLIMSKNEIEIAPSILMKYAI